MCELEQLIELQTYAHIHNVPITLIDLSTMKRSGLPRPYIMTGISSENKIVTENNIEM